MDFNKEEEEIEEGERILNDGDESKRDKAEESDETKFFSFNFINRL
jgi:hypothetical protein